MTHTVADLMATHVICISPLENVAQARELLRTYRVSALPVEDEARRAVGIVTAICGGPFFVWLYRLHGGSSYFD